MVAIESGSKIKEAKTWQLPWSDGIDEMIKDTQYRAVSVEWCLQ